MNKPMEDTRRDIHKSYDWTGNCYEGRVIVRRNYRFGFVDLDGNEVVPLIYDHAGNFHEGRVNVRLNGKRGFVDLNGNEVVSPVYDMVGDFSEGRARVVLNGKLGVIDLGGNVVLPCWYDSVEIQSYGFMTTHLVSVRAVEDLYFDKDGNQIAEPTLK
jgi:hypothetical protein